MFRIAHPNVEGDAVIGERALAAAAAKGWVLVGRVDATAVAEPGAELKQPAKSASAAAWKTYAVATGMPYDDAMALGRDELAELYQPSPAPKAPAKAAPAVTNTQES